MPLRKMEKDSVLVGRRWLRELLFADWGLKLLALAITLSLWYGVTGQRVPTAVRLRGVPLFFLLPNDIEISNDPREEVEVMLRGNKRTLDALKASDIVINFDARQYQPGERVVRLTPETVTLELPEGVSAEGLTIERIEPNSVPLKLERRIEREIEIEAKLEGKLTEGYELKGVQVTPNRVRVRGPESHVSALQKIYTEAISLDGRNANFDAAQTALDISDRKVVALNPVVDVQIMIDEVQAEKHLVGVGVRLANGDEAQPAHATIDVRGARSIVENLRAEDVSLILDPNAGGAPRPRLSLPSKAAGRVELVSTNPTEFSINR